jgi:hypothetical protein
VDGVEVFVIEYGWSGKAKEKPVIEVGGVRMLASIKTGD